MNIFSQIVIDNRITTADLPELEGKLFFEGDRRRINLERFAILLFLSSIIATYGVLGDSVATVIGAMIVAPLMTPIMATAAALVMGDMKRAANSFTTVVLGIASVIFISWFIATFLNTTIISISTNSQISGRISPSLTDLAVALASGAAGAFAMSRADIADSLPGVAISISLVPPLCVVGIALGEENTRAALGAMILFLTNLFSILLAGGGTLALLGLSMASARRYTGKARRNAFIAVVIGTFFVAVPLTLSSLRVTEELRAEMETRASALAWLATSDFEVRAVNADGDRVILTISGTGELPDVDVLGEQLRQVISPDLELVLQVVPSQTLGYPELPTD